MKTANRMCPKCGAPLQDEARFCPHCMTSLVEKTALSAAHPPKKNRLWLFVLIGILVIAAAVCALLFLKPAKPDDPAKSAKSTSDTPSAAAPSLLCSFEDFAAAAPLVSEKMGISDLWDPESLVDTRYNQTRNIRQYVADTALEGTLFSVFFFNEGEKISASVCDVTPEQYADAQNLLKCVVQSACNYYYTDIDQVFSDEKRYPKTPLEEPFSSDLTDLQSRTETYTADLENGTVISSRYLWMDAGDKAVLFLETKRDNGDTVLYDLAVEIERSPA